MQIKKIRKRRTDVGVRVGSRVVQVDVENAHIRAIAPIAAHFGTLAGADRPRPLLLRCERKRRTDAGARAGSRADQVDGENAHIRATAPIAACIAYIRA